MSEAPTAKKIKPPRVLVLFSIAEGSPRLELAVTPPAEERYPTARKPLYVPPADRAVPAHVEDVARALAANGFAVSVVNIADDPERLLGAIHVEAPDLVFNMVSELEGTSLNQHLVPTLLDWLGVPYAGSEPGTLATCLNRAHTRVLLADAGVPVPRFAVIRDINAVPDTPGFRKPLIVTQAFDDVYESDGHNNPLYDWESVVARATALATEYLMPLLVEEYVGYRRLHVVALGNTPPQLLPIVETDMPEVATEPPPELEDDADDELDADDEFDSEVTAESAVGAALDHVAESEGADDTGESERAASFTPLELGYIYLAQMEPEQASRVRAVASRALKVLGCRDCAVVDVHLDEEGNPYVVDVRPMFDIRRGYAFSLAADSTERGYDLTIAELARAAMRRSGLEDAALLTEKLTEMFDGAGAPAPTPPPDEPALAEPAGPEPRS